MNQFIYKNKSFFLILKRNFNRIFGIDIIKYPDENLKRRITLLNYHKIEVILDIGANIGQYGSEMRNAGFTGKIISFEPLKDAFEKLRKLAENDSNWEVYNCSIGERDGKAIINVAKNSVSSSLLNNLPQLTESAPLAETTRQEEIEIKKLDSIFNSLAIADKNIYAKIDTQGYEKMVLDGATESLKKIKGLQIEMALIPSYDGGIGFDEMRKRVENEFNFKLASIETGFFDPISGNLLEVDGIFYK